MPATHGMNLAEVEELGNYLRASGRELIDSLLRINSELDGASWVGSDAETFKEVWWPEHLIALKRVANDLEGFGQSALNNAQEQRNVSSTGGTSGPAPGAPSNPAYMETDRSESTIAHRIPNGSHASTSDYVSEIQHLREGEIAVRQVSDGPPPRYVVMLRGMGHPIYGGSHDLVSTVADGLGVPSDYKHEIDAVLDGLGDAEIALIGHSQGGIAAVELAELSEHNITHVLTMGSLVSGRDIPDSVSVLSVENNADLVPLLDLDPLRVFESDRIQTVGFNSGALMPLSGHDIATDYLPAVEELEGIDHEGISMGSGASSASQWLSDFENRFGGDGASGSAYLAGDEPELVLANRPTF